MSNSGSTRVLGPKALEMIMRDVLGGMEELSLMKGYQPASDIVEIIAVEPGDSSDPAGSTKRPRVVDLQRYRRRKAG